MKAVIVLFDSLNRHALPIYGSDWCKAPNFERLAQRSVVFDNHWLGSAPCMPARRDMQTGRLNFLERPWSGLEPFEIERVLPNWLRSQGGVFSHMETDHYHYWYPGGEGYCQVFDTFAFHRGQEYDRWVSRVDGYTPPKEYLGQLNPYHMQNREEFKDQEKEFPSPRTLRGATEWLKANEEADNWLLWVEAFDPHEPFDTPDENLQEYGDVWEGPEFRDHKYGPVETYPGAADHGHFVGERGYNGKNLYHVYNELAHIPCVMHVPGDRFAGERRAHLTQNIDILPTVCEHFGVKPPEPIHGRSWWPIVNENESNGREYCLYGWHGSSVNVTDGKYTYLRAPATEENRPLYIYGIQPNTFHHIWNPEHVRKLEAGRYLPYVDGNVWRFEGGGRRLPLITDNLLYDLDTDHAQQNNLAAAAPGEEDDLEQYYIDLLKRALREHDAPAEQNVRLGIGE